MQETKHPHCIYPDCTCTRRTRGLCHAHYQAMRSAVRNEEKLRGNGGRLERDLEARGLLLQPGTGGGPKVGKCDAFRLGSEVRGDG